MKKIFICLSLISLISCNNHMRVKSSIMEPEVLLDSYAEKISFSLKDEKSFNNLSDLIANDKPSKANISCYQSNNLCMKVKNFLTLNNIKYTANNTNNDPKIILDFNRVIAKDCKSFDTTTKELKFGCATSANMIQMISDHKQLSDPDIMDYSNATKAIQNYNNYLRNRK